MPLNDSERAILQALSWMDQQGEAPEEVDAVVELLRGILRQDKHTIYRLLHALTLYMKARGHHITGQLLEQARYAFYHEGQRNELPEDDENTSAGPLDGDFPPDED